MALGQKRFRAFLVPGVGVAVDEHDGGCFNVQLFELFAQRRQSGFIKRRYHFTVGTYTLLDLKA